MTRNTPMTLAATTLLRDHSSQAQPRNTTANRAGRSRAPRSGVSGVAAATPPELPAKTATAMRYFMLVLTGGSPIEGGCDASTLGLAGTPHLGRTGGSGAPG